MAKKMHDILPPGLRSKPKNAVKELKVNIKKPAPTKSLGALKRKKPVLPVPPKVKETLLLPEYDGKRRFPLKEILIGGAVIILLLCVWAYIKLPKAEVSIWPKQETLTLPEKLTADTSATTVDFAKKIIPARYVQMQKDASQEFPATGLSNSDALATGTIKIYNKISPSSPFTLIKGTHFLSDSGKYFVTTQKVVIPGSKNNVPGSVNATVQAEQSGVDYNISASKFSIPKLNGTTYYYSLYGESTSPMSGGHTGSVKKVTDDDIASAKDILTKQLLDKAQVALQSSLAVDDILLDGASVQNVVSAGSSLKSGAIADTFSETASVKVSGLVFKKQDINSFIKSDATAKLDPGNNFLENTLHIAYNSQSLDVQKGKLSLDVSADIKTYYVVNPTDLINVFSNKSSDQIKQAASQLYGDKISELKVNFWPFWVIKAPSDKKRITITTLFK